MQKTYNAAVMCTNCGFWNELHIAQGTTVKQHLTKKENQKCNRCETVSLQRIK